MNLRAFLQSSLQWPRRKADAFIKEHGVQIDGKTIYAPWTDIDPTTQKIYVQGRHIKSKAKHVYIIFNKPLNTICSHKSQGPVKTIFKLLPQEFSHLRLAGRLDKNSHGLVILSNDGYFLQYLSRPEYEFKRIYEVTVKGFLDRNRLHQYSKSGWRLETETYRPFSYKILKSEPKLYRIQIILSEGKKREIRYLFQKLNTKVSDLIKLVHGPIELGSLKAEKWRHLEPNIIKKVLEAKR